MTARSRLAALIALSALAACGSGRADPPPDGEAFLLAEGAEPALRAALEDPILTDPELAEQAHPHTVRPPEYPVQAQYPAGSANESVPATASPARALCGTEFDRGEAWAGRLPAELPLYPGAAVTEAAGIDSGECRLRFVAFETGDDLRRLLGHFRDAAARAGYSVRHRQRGADHVLAGAEPGTGAVFVLLATPLEGGTEAALLVDGGR